MSHYWASMDDLPDVTWVGQFVVAAAFVLGIADGPCAYPNSVPKEPPRLSVVPK